MLMLNRSLFEMMFTNNLQFFFTLLELSSQYDMFNRSYGTMQNFICE